MNRFFIIIFKFFITLFKNILAIKDRLFNNQNPICPLTDRVGTLEQKLEAISTVEQQQVQPKNQFKTKKHRIRKRCPLNEPMHSSSTDEAPAIKPRRIKTPSEKSSKKETPIHSSDSDYIETTDSIEITPDEKLSSASSKRKKTISLVKTAV